MTIRLAYVTTVPETQWELLRGQNLYVRQHGFELHSIASPGKRLQDLAERDGVVPHAVPISRSIKPLADLLSLVRLFLVFRKIRPDIIHVSTSKAAVLGALAGWLARVPVRVFLIRGLASEGATGVAKRIFRALERVTVGLCHRSICVAPSLLTYARDQGILRPDQGCVMANGMSNGVDLARFDPQSTTPVQLERWLETGAVPGRPVVIGYVGRIAKKKGILEIADMWNEVRDAFPETVLMLVGPWESLDDQTRQLRSTWESDPRVIMPGFVDDVVPFLSVMDLFVMPTRGTEGFPNAPMQAACMELPVIATRVVGCVDAVAEGETGKLIPTHDASALTQCVRYYLEHPDQRARHGVEGRRRVVKDFAQQPIWDAFIREYRRLLDEHNVEPSTARQPLASESS